MNPPGAGAPPTGAPVVAEGGPLAVFRIRPFLLLWLSQASTQIGGNMVIYGLTVIIFTATRSNSAVSILLLTFLVPAVVFSAVAGVYVDRVDRRDLLVVTNILRGLSFIVLFFVGNNLLLIYLLNVLVSTVTTFFAPAELAMIPFLVPRHLLLAANGVFTLTMNVAFALGFALLGPLVVTLAGPAALLLLVGAFYLAAAGFCFTLPRGAPATGVEPHAAGLAVAEAERAVESTIAELGYGLAYIRHHRSVGWSLSYLGITASLIGVLGVLGPAFATQTLGLAPRDFVVVVLPLGLGVVTGILLLNSYGRYLPRRRLIEGGLVLLGILLAILSIAGPITHFLQRRLTATGGLVDVSSVVSLLSVVVIIAFLAGVAYAVVAIPSQTQLQEDLPQEVRGRVFGVLNMLVSVASFLPIIVVGPISDAVGTTSVIFVAALLIAFAGIASAVGRGPLTPLEAVATAAPTALGPVDPLAVAMHADLQPAPSPEEAGGDQAEAGQGPEPDSGPERAQGPSRRDPAPAAGSGNGTGAPRVAGDPRPRRGRGRTEGQADSLWAAPAEAGAADGTVAAPDDAPRGPGRA